MKFQIDRCFDSHVHLRPTGELLSMARLEDTGDLIEWKKRLLACDSSVAASNSQSPWVRAFGWDPGQFAALASISKVELDGLESRPLLISHRDGHSSVLNSAGLRSLGWTHLSDVPEKLRGQVSSNAALELTGPLREEAHFHALRQIPAASADERKLALLKAQNLFIQQGFTHVREMMGDADLLQDLLDLENEKTLQLSTEVFLHLSVHGDIQKLLTEAQNFDRNRSRKTRVLGIKVFLDGALGSEGACLSTPYGGHLHGHSGNLLWSNDLLCEVMTKTWAQGLRLAVHAIGDASLSQLLTVAQGLRAQGLEGPISIEHAEVIHPDAFLQMQQLFLEFHFQPSHFLSDQAFLKQKLGERFSWCFPWNRVETLGFPIFFGSDSPIEAPSLRRTIEGLKQSAAAGIPRCDLDWKFAHSHPDKRWGKGSYSLIAETGEVLEVFVEQKRVFKNENPFG